MNNDFNNNDFNNQDDEFNFDDMNDAESNAESNNNRNKIIKWVIIAVVSIIVGLIVFFVSDKLINGGKDKEKPKQPVVKDEELLLNDKMVSYLYNNVSYEIKGVRNNTFFKKDMKASDFTNEEKFLYAFRFINSKDFIRVKEEVKEEDKDIHKKEILEEDSNKKTDKVKEEKPVVLHKYSIANEKIKKAMFNFFGKDVTYSKEGKIPVVVNFTVNGFNTGDLVYDEYTDTFVITFDRFTGLKEDEIIKHNYSKLVSAKRLVNGNIILVEKVVFTKYLKDNELYNYNICSDIECNNVIDNKQGISKEQFLASGVKVDSYLDKALTVTYTFNKDNNNEYHFLSSKLN